MKDKVSGDRRAVKLGQWLDSLSAMPVDAVVPASDDASFRRYFRVTSGGNTYIAMDAPPDREDCKRFAEIARAMRQIGLNVPEILHANIHDGFLLLTDFGDSHYLSELNSANVDRLYHDAMQSLLTLQASPLPQELLPDYDRTLLLNEMALFEDWFIGQLLGISLSGAQSQLLRHSFEMLATNALQQPRVWVHRDYHSRNLMYVEEGNPGILDFQDAVVGPLTYDLVSLLRDCYINWPEQSVYGWVEDYHQLLVKQGLVAVDYDIFCNWFDWMGVQRHLKAIGIFARLNIRDNKPGYIRDIPRTFTYVLAVARRYEALQPLCEWLTRTVVPRMNECDLAINE